MHLLRREPPNTPLVRATTARSGIWRPTALQKRLDVTGRGFPIVRKTNRNPSVERTEALLELYVKDREDRKLSQETFFAVTDQLRSIIQNCQTAENCSRELKIKYSTWRSDAMPKPRNTTISQIRRLGPTARSGSISHKKAVTKEEDRGKSSVGSSEEQESKAGEK